jgi:hypothetical protein
MCRIVLLHAILTLLGGGGLVLGGNGVGGQAKAGDSGDGHGKRGIMFTVHRRVSFQRVLINFKSSRPPHWRRRASHRAMAVPDGCNQSLSKLLFTENAGDCA